MRKILNRNSKDFYKYMGPIFGSREIQRITNDRFFDDEGKDWYLNIDDDEVTAVISVKNSDIKNVYLKNFDESVKLLKDIKANISKGIVPSAYESLFREAGYETDEHSTNYIKVGGGKDEQDK